MTAHALSVLDHLVYATPDLDRGVQQISDLLGGRPPPGGSHPGFGTRNALLALDITESSAPALVAAIDTPLSPRDLS